jgi:two-component system nitrogen regulation response regulator GlnG
MMPKDRALEVLFQAAVEDSELALLPWIEREFTLRAMQKTDNNQVRAAKLLGITRATLRKRLDRNTSIEEIEEE